MIAFLVLLILAILVVGALFKWQLPKQVRMITFGKRDYVRFFPNPGLTIGAFHWCRYRGKGVH